MNLEKRFPINLDSVAGLVTGLLLFAIALVLWLGQQIGIQVTAELPMEASAGPYTPLTIKFSEPVDGALALERFALQPANAGTFKWSDNKTLQFIPREPLQPDTTYTLTLTPGALTKTGQLLKKTKTWNFHTRQPLIVYLVIKDGVSRLWTVNLSNGATQPLMDASLKIFDYDAAPNGEFIILAAFNVQQGIDLWQLGRAGGTPHLLLQCGTDRCSVPAISPDSRQIAYVREAAAPSPDLAFGSPRIRILNLENKQDAPLYEDQQIIGYDPSWSPDGTRLSSYDGFKDEIRLLDMITGAQTIIPSQTGMPTTWSADSATFVFTDINTNEFGLHTRIREAKTTLSEITTLFGENDERDYVYNTLAWSPVKNKLVIGLRPHADDPAEALWLMNPTLLDGQVIVEQPNYIYTNPAWNPWGSAIVFQQFKLKGVYKPEIGFWTTDQREHRILAEGIMPEWLP